MHKTIKQDEDADAAMSSAAAATANAPAAAAIDESQVVKAPQKKFFRSRAHCNPLSHNDSFE